MSENAKGDTKGRATPGPVVSIRGLHHYTISAPDLVESARRYAEKLGFRPSVVRREHAWGAVGYLTGPGKCLLEMFEAPGGAPVPAYAMGPEPDTDLTVCGHKHMALLLAGTLDSALEELRMLQADIADVKRVSLEGIGEFKAVFIADNSGGLIELPEGAGADEPGMAAAAESRGGPREAGSAPPVRITGLHHVAVAVPDREEAMEWYSRVFGFTVATTFEVPAIGLRTAMMQGPGFWIELHSMAGALAVPADRKDPRTDLRTLGNKYFALEAADLDGVAEVFDKSGVSVVAELFERGARRLFVGDVAGNPIELFQETG